MSKDERQGMTNEEIAALALAVMVRNREQQEPTADVGDHFPDEWVDLYRRFAALSRWWEDVYPDPQYRVHQIVEHPNREPPPGT